jgi:hypothetical protein
MYVVSFKIIYCFWFNNKVQRKYKETCLSEVVLCHSQKFRHLKCKSGLKALHFSKTQSMC